MKRLRVYLLLMRPANIVTSVADVLAGIAISGIFLQENFLEGTIGDIILLCLATIGLYGGGIVFNDVFDYELDCIERPERVIPSGQMSLKAASTLASSLLAFGIIMALFVNITAAWFAIFISISALVYDKWGKHHSILGPPNMGLCRGLNLLLGVSILPMSLNDTWYIAFVPILYISAITMISRGEVHGSNKKPLLGAVALYSIVILMILAFAWNRDTIVFALPFLLAFGWMIFTPLLKAIKTPTGPAIGKSVKAGVMALILMNSAWAASTGAWSLAILIVFLLPVSLWLSREFAVT